MSSFEGCFGGSARIDMKYLRSSDRVVEKHVKSRLLSLIESIKRLS